MTKLIALLILPFALVANTLTYNSPMMAKEEPAIANIQLNENNFVLLRGTVEEDSVAYVQNEIARLVNKRGFSNYTIYLILDSGGGQITSGMELIESIKTTKNLETITIFAASMASAIVEALPGQRNILSTGILMFHRARGGVQGQFDGELETQLLLWKKVIGQLEQTNADRMKMPIADYRARVINEMWFFGPENLTNNAADRIITVTCVYTLTKAQKCPVIKPRASDDKDMRINKKGSTK